MKLRHLYLVFCLLGLLLPCSQLIPWIIEHHGLRVGGKIFATLGYPDKDSAMVKLTPGEQREFVRSNPRVFKPVKGAWGRQGSTNVYLPTAKIDIVREALTAAWRNTAPNRL